MITGNQKIDAKKISQTSENDNIKLMVGVECKRLTSYRIKSKEHDYNFTEPWRPTGLLLIIYTNGTVRRIKL